MSNEMLKAATLFATVFILTVFFEARLIPVLRRAHAGQPILEIGPAWHMVKAGTPTLGGLGFVLAVMLASWVLVFWSSAQGVMDWQKPLLILLYAFLCACIGFLDDWLKLSKKENKGLSALQKYGLQLLVSLIFLVLAERFFGLEKAIPLPFGDRVLELGNFYYPLAILYLTGVVNALNLTDGLDGLLSSVCGISAAFFIVWGRSIGEESAVLVGAMLLGATLGFLCFNAHPAKIFMGDTGSLFLGGAVAAFGVLSPSPLTVLLAGGVFVIEAFSVLLQVVWFKLSRGKRLFRMAPLHHHFEKLGWSEERVVAVFSAASAFFALLAFLWR